MEPLEEVDFSKYFTKLDPETYAVFQTFNQLRTTAIKYNVQLALPEIVVVGMQSVGKSSLIEAFAGLRLNNCGYGTKTRRPMVLEMLQNDEYQHHPHCQFGHLPHPTPIDLVADIVIDMNEQVGSGFSTIPIQLKIEHAAMPNLVIVDTPGFQPENKDLRDLIRDQMLPPNRFIVCLESSKTAWEGFTFTSLVNEVDPDWSRTIVVVTKFNYLLCSDIMDNEEIARQYLAPYFQGRGQKTGQTIIRTKDVFFIDLLPKRDEVRAEDLKTKNVSLLEYHQSIEIATRQVFNNIMKVPRDIKPDESKLGFYNLKAHLESRLKDKIVSYAKPLQIKINQELRSKEDRMKELKGKIIEMESINYKNETIAICSLVSGKVQQIFNGEFHGLDRTMGQTLEEELAELGEEWSAEHIWESWGCVDGLDLTFDSHNAKIMGQAQYQRILREFEVALRAQELPMLTQEELWKYLGNNSAHDIPDFKHSVSSIVRNLAEEMFQPIAFRVAERLSHFFDYQMEMARTLADDSLEQSRKLDSSKKKKDWLKYDVLLDFVQDEYFKAIEVAKQDCLTDMTDYLAATLAVINFGTSFRSRNLTLPRGYDVTAPTPEATLQRVADEMEEDWTRSDFSNFNTKWDMDDIESQKMIMKWAMLNFCSVRQQLTTSWRILTEKHFRIPLVESISHTIMKMIRNKTPKQCQREFFASDYDDLVTEADKLAQEVEGYKTASVQIAQLGKILK
eukprot:Phypoly_transcript_03494.p1 GENE.Phypoly_transcript_03494~~Phypoly_transcript_03494.p1  ORF type:complete len:731 (+),score=114.92 Phypoly_transcript_03494:172-2364(+)